jgi:DNA polymerase III gamma/tau subunit
MNLATKLRPNSLSQIVGQPNAVQQITTWAQTGNFPHCVAITGSFGTGKTSLARIIARIADNIPANIVPVDKWPDVEEINAADKRGIDDLRKIVANLGYLPMRSKYRIIIIDEAHMIQQPAASVLLKPLEEPPAHIMVILVTSAPERMSAGLFQSGRCVVLNLNLLSRKDLMDVLLRVGKAENILWPPRPYQSLYIGLAENSNGNPRLAISMMEAAVAALGKRPPTPELLRSVLLAAHNSVPEIAVNKLAVMALLGIYGNNHQIIIRVCSDIGKHSPEYFITRMLEFNLWLFPTQQTRTGNIDQQALYGKLNQLGMPLSERLITVQNGLIDLLREVKTYLIEPEYLVSARLLWLATKELKHE